MAFPVSKDDAKHAIGELIKNQGLDAVTSAKIRNVLKEKFGQDFTAWKKEVDELTREKIEEVMAKKEAKERSASPAVASGSSSNSGNANDSDSDSDSGPDDVEPVKKGSARKRVSAASSAHIDENEDMLSRVKRRRGNAVPAKTKAAKTSKPRTKGTSGFSNVCFLSEELQAITGKAYMRRCDIVKCMWEYIRANNLKSPKDGRIVICDENLQRCCKKPRFQAFGMMSWMKNHIFKPEDMGEEYVAEAQKAQEELVKELNDGAHANPADVEGDDANDDE